MNQPKNRVTILLMLSSIALLLALQVFWLTNSYEKSNLDLRKETNGIFRTTISAMRDSMLIKQIQQLPADSVPLDDDIVIRHRRPDSTEHSLRKDQFQFKQNSTQIQIYVRSGRPLDSLQTVLRPFASRVQGGQFSGGGNFIFRIGPDSLSVDSIGVNFRKALSKPHEGLPFTIKHDAFLPSPATMGRNIRTPFRPFEDSDDEIKEFGLFSNTIQTDWVRIDPVHRYAAVLSGIRSILIKEIAPQILFSLFLTLLTTGSFVVIYRSLRAQQRLMVLKNDFISNVNI